MDYAPCPQCRASVAEKLKFTWWGGVLGPKILTHVKCTACGFKYNGKSGKNNTTGIVIYTVVVGILSLFLVIVVFGVLGFLMYASK